MNRPAVTRREALALGGLVGVGALVLTGVRRLQPVGPDIGRTPVVDAIQSDRMAPVGGNRQGDVALHVWTDFNCPACRRSHGEMMAAVAEDGSTRIVFRDWPIFGADSEEAASHAIASDIQGLYEPVHTRLMQGGRANAGAAEAAVAAAGGDVDRLRADLAARLPIVNGMLARHAREGFALGLGGTPGHLIGTILMKGARHERDFRRAIRQARDTGPANQAGFAPVNR